MKILLLFSEIIIDQESVIRNGTYVHLKRPYATVTVKVVIPSDASSPDAGNVRLLFVTGSRSYFTFVFDIFALKDTGENLKYEAER